ncbi:hypothetical protein [Paenibacillus sp. KS-LC4]|uniref:hypothetical protein n=1 Tax=Paenibacillus sp. KS-LC4 TaxID=2979727 RepID=UPI0030CFB782
MSIRPIERTNRRAVFEPIQRISPYASYPYRDMEFQRPPEHDFDWNDPYREAAGHAAVWLEQYRQAHKEVQVIALKILNDFNERCLVEQLTKLTGVINRLQQAFVQVARYIKPSLWDRAQQAMNHHASALVGFIRDDVTSRWMLRPAITASIYREYPLSGQHLYRQLLGPYGLMTTLLQALSLSGDEIRTTDLLKNNTERTQPYATYYSSMKMHYPLPRSGLLLNNEG